MPGDTPAFGSKISPANRTFSIPLAVTGVPKGAYVATENVALVAPDFQTCLVLPRASLM
jgi:hypothetical protein